MCHGISWRARITTYGLFSASTASRVVVSTISWLCFYCWARVYDWTVENEKVGSIYLYEFGCSQSDSITGNGSMEYFGPSSSSDSCFLCSQACFQNVPIIRHSTLVFLLQYAAKQSRTVRAVRFDGLVARSK
jgi:hypothetical protein